MAPCLEKLVPIVQQAQVDFMADPGRTNAMIIEMVETIGSFWTYDEGIAAYSVQSQSDLGLVSNGPNEALGDFIDERTNAVLDQMRAAGMEVPADLSASDMSTNRFIDYSIGLPGGAETAAPAAEEAAADSSGGGVLVVGQNFYPNQQASLDPRIMSTSTNGEFLDEIYATLLRIDHTTGAYEPYLAESYELIDSQTVTITIRSDANFHDGRPVTSADAKASIEATLANTIEGTCNCNKGIKIIDSVEVVDDKTFTVNLSKPGLATIFELMTGPEFMISPADAGASQASAPVGNGPFRFVELDEGQRITLEKWDDFFGADDVMLGGLEFVNLKEGTTQLNALMAGDIDMAMELDFPTFESASQRDGFTGSAVQSDTTFVWFTACQAESSVFADIRVRQGIMHSIDRDLINEAIYGGWGVPSVGLYPPGHPYNDPSLDDIYPYDLDRARELFEEAGVVGTTLGVWATSSIPESIDLILVINQSTSQAGLTLEPHPTDDLVGDYLRAAALDDPPYELDHDGVLITQSRPGMQKLTRLFLPGQITNPCSKPDQGPEYERAVEIVDLLFGLAPDDPEAIVLWKEIQRFNLEQARHMVLQYFPAFTAWSDSVGGVDPNTFGAPINGGYSFSRMTKVG
jgi:ABC-type transport system substrate-binding protein